ncbi:MAG: FAD-dependent oxidoreductase [Clostridia bacterium]|nr:FAD-dependent oxidoreductase [Clostridia bacterium]
MREEKMNKSIWTENVQLPSFEKLEGDIKTDVLVIGGGLCGILCALRLKEAGVDFILTEKNRIGSGVTQNTTAKITSQHGLIYAKLLQKRGRETAQKYLFANEKAIHAYEKLALHCNFEKKEALTYSLSDRRKIEEEVKAVSSLGLSADFVENTELPFPVRGAIRFRNQACFHPLRFLAEITGDLPIYEDTPVEELMPGYAVTSSGKIHFKACIIATHFPILNKHGAYFLKLYQHRSYVTAVENAPHFSGMYVDESMTGFSFRNFDKYLFIGGGDHRTGKKGIGWDSAESVLKKYYPAARRAFTWATQDCMSLDGLPYIGAYGKHADGLYVATGFNKWGMTSSMVAADILCDLVQGKKNEFADVYSPQRSILTPQLFVNGIEAVASILTPTKPRCPHMGCALKWNKNERTWDCPCHGSRFSAEGKVLDNPSTENINKS